MVKEMPDKATLFNRQRRTLLIAASSGVIAFILGKIFGPSINWFSEDYPLSEKSFENFRVVDTKKELKLYDRGGNEVIIIEKEGFTQ